MNEFALIATFFKTIQGNPQNVVFGIGDDAACVTVPSDKELLISTDTLNVGVHFLQDWDPFDIAWKAVMVNVSDIAAMGGNACWITLALTLPNSDESWLNRFSLGLQQALQTFNLGLIGGDISHGPLSITITAHGLISTGKAVRRNGAKLKDSIWVTGELGAAALGVIFAEKKDIPSAEAALLTTKLKHPFARIDMNAILQDHASAAIDISDGLAADLNHICQASQVGACLNLASIPVHPLVKKHKGKEAAFFALQGGDDYELCFTVPKAQEQNMLTALKANNLYCFCIGAIETQAGIRLLEDSGEVTTLEVKGYTHF